MSDRPIRWRSKTVHLALLGGAGGLMATALAGCGQGSDADAFHQNVYRSEADCRDEYGSFDCRPLAGLTPRCAPDQPSGACDEIKLKVIRDFRHLGIGGGEKWTFGPAYRVVNGVPKPCTSRDPGAGRIPPGGQSRRTMVLQVERSGFGADCAVRTSSRRRSGRSSFYRST